MAHTAKSRSLNLRQRPIMVRTPQQIATTQRPQLTPQAGSSTASASPLLTGKREGEA